MTQYWMIVSTSFLGGNMWAHPQLLEYTLLSMLASCLATGSIILVFIENTSNLVLLYQGSCSLTTCMYCFLFAVFVSVDACLSCVVWNKQRKKEEKESKPTRSMLASLDSEERENPFLRIQTAYVSTNAVYTNFPAASLAAKRYSVLNSRLWPLLFPIPYFTWIVHVVFTKKFTEEI